MNGSARILLTACLAGAFTPAVAAEVKAVFGLGMKAAMEAAAPHFERATGHRLTLVFEPPGPAHKRLADGEMFDVIAMPRAAIEALEREGRAPAGASVPVARTRMGIAVRKGAPKPDISTPEALKRALLEARAVVHSDPARGGAGGINTVRLFEKLGIAPEMKAKTVYPRVHSPAGVAQEVADGRADLAFNQLQELLQPTLDVVGPFPGDLQQEVVFMAAVPAVSAQPAAAKKLVDFLGTPEARAILKAHGLD